MRLAARTAIALLAAAAGLLGQNASRTLLGTVTAFKAEALAIDIRLDNQQVTTVKVGADTIVQRVAPGEKDLRKAAAIKITDVALGDRVLVSLVGGMDEARRIIVMAADDITKQREAERLNWQQHGLAGVVFEIKGSQITLKSRSFMGDSYSVVTVSPETTFRRYKPDSVKFADAVVSKLSEVKTGDQLRARGAKSEDGKKVAANEIVFGSFLTKAGTITAIDAAGGTLTIKDVENNKPLTVKVTADAQMKKMPEMPAMAGGMGRGGQGGMARGGPGGAGGPPDIAQMLERFPAVALADLKTGESIIVSATRGASAKEITAIMLVANAQRLIEMATAQSNNRGGLSIGGGGGMGMGNAGGGLDLMGIMP
jgi:hypothetical protein